MTQPQPDENLAPARDRLHNAISALIDPRTEPTEDGCSAEVPSLYQQLYDAVPGEQGAGWNGAPQSQPPCWLDAVKVLGEIDGQVRKWQPHYPHCQHCKHCNGHLPTVWRLERLAERTWRPQDTRLLYDMAGQLERWAIDADTLLTPQHKLHLAAACLECKVKTVYRRDSAGELVRVPALQIGPDGCECQNCHYVWAPYRFHILAEALDCPLPEGVLE